jgi:maleate isomerase
MAPGQVVTRVSRIVAPGIDLSCPGPPPTSLSGLNALTEPSVLDTAAAALPPDAVDAIGYASTSSGYAIGFDAEAAMVDRLSQRWSLPVAGTSMSAVAALRAVDVQRVALVHPPWFAAELNVLGAEYFRSQGLDVVSAESARLPNDPRLIEPSAIVDWITRFLSDDAEAVFIGGTGFRAAQAIAALEASLGRPVLESNQVLLWSILAKLEAVIEVAGFGLIFDHDARD